MPSLPQLLHNHGRLLVLDASSARTQTGLLRDQAIPLWEQTDAEAGTGIFAGAAAVLQQAGQALDGIGAFVYCEGPGSLLGARTIAMTLRTWQVTTPRPIYSYQSLTVAAVHAWNSRPARAFSLIIDARRESWHCQQVAADGALAALERVPADALPSGELVTPEHFRAWSEPPRAAGRCTYDLSRIFPALGTGDYFHFVEVPGAVRHAAPEYKKWSAQIHQAPVPPAR